MARNTTELDPELFDIAVSEFLEFLFEATPKLPGPKHPNTKYYENRKKKRNTVQSAKQSKSSNPQRKDKKAKERRRQDYMYKKVQYDFNHQRKKTFCQAIGEKPATACPIPMDDLKKHFESTFGTPNDSVLPNYPSYEAKEDIEVTQEEMNSAIRSISLGTAPGSDRVPSKTVRDLKVAAIIREIVEIMLATGLVPSKLREGKTILIHKGGAVDDPANYRPITINSVVRRIIERVLDKHLRHQVELNCNQRGFVNLPGCDVNANQRVPTGRKGA